MNASKLLIAVSVAFGLIAGAANAAEDAGGAGSVQAAGGAGVGGTTGGMVVGGLTLLGAGVAIEDDDSAGTTATSGTTGSI